MAQLTTLILWLLCAGVGGFGFLRPYLRPQPAARPPVTTVEMLNVQLSAVPEVQPAPPGGSPACAAPMNLPAVPQLAMVAEPSAAIAFALPAESVSVTSEARAASHFQAAPARNSSPTVQQITFGQGEGRQPAPDYPPRARREGQQGTVVVRLTVGESGGVLAAEAVKPSPWPLLNESAVRAVKSRWLFASGRPRVYEVPIRFELN
ncbi:MAG: TonB family protein [Verrucomicrobiota bacterium]